MKSGFVSPVYLHNLLQQGGGKHPIVLEVSWNERASKYDKGHIPGAIYVNTDEVEYDLFKARVSTNAKDLRRSTTEVQDLAKGLTKEDTLPQNWWNIYPDRYLLPALAHIGVDVNSSVVVYGDDPNAASRLAWVMLYAGVRKVQVLDGGLQAWKRAGFEVSIVPVVRKSVKCFGTEKPRRSEYRVDLPGVRAEIGFNRADFVLADIRTKGEYAGRTTPYDYINTKGRIKGAHWGRAGTCRTTMESYLNEMGRSRRWKRLKQCGSKVASHETSALCFTVVRVGDQASRSSLLTSWAGNVSATSMAVGTIGVLDLRRQRIHVILAMRDSCTLLHRFVIPIQSRWNKIRTKLNFERISQIRHPNISKEMDR